MWLLIVGVLPLAFLPEAYNSFGPVKRDCFHILALIQIALLVLRYRRQLAVIARQAGASPVFWPLAATVMLAGLPLLGARISLTELYPVLEGVFAGTLAIALLVEPDRTIGRKILVVHLVSVAIASIYAFAQYGGVDPFVWRTGFAGAAPASTYGNPLFLADGVSAALITAVAFFAAGRGLSRSLWGSLAVVFLLALLLTQARGAWLGTSVALAVLLVWLGRSGAWPGVSVRRDLCLAGLVVAALVLVLCLPGLSRERRVPVLSHAASIFDPFRDEYRGRYLLWETTARMAREKPLLGWRPGQLRIRYTEFQALLLTSPRYASLPYHSTSHSHQDFLQLLAERGVIGLGVALWILVCAGAILRPGRRCGRTRGTIACVLLAWTVNACFNGPLHVPPSSILFYLLVALVWHRSPGREANARNESPPTFPLALACGFAVLTCSAFVRDLVGEGYLRRTVTAIEDGRPAQALLMGLRAYAFSLEDRRQHYFIGQAYLELGDYDDAADEFGKDVIVNPGYASGWRDLGLAEYGRGQRSAALSALRRALRLNPRDEKSAEMIRQISDSREKSELTGEKAVDKLK